MGSFSEGELVVNVVCVGGVVAISIHCSSRFIDPLRELYSSFLHESLTGMYDQTDNIIRTPFLASPNNRGLHPSRLLLMYVQHRNKRRQTTHNGRRVCRLIQEPQIEGVLGIIHSPLILTHECVLSCGRPSIEPLQLCVVHQVLNKYVKKY
ncbi:hypothetical protein B0H66DRAFT_545975 [Apodospora peruviana]|uniref:Uncharacterized protein n=1 Tax=Apodospora peruviana TaxID=516989 RepID=A0AAE0ITS2_9PEZI|nr:hypothetical protein B0H66DRAFT_545975 [Apodospora peruviana]